MTLVIRSYGNCQRTQAQWGREDAADLGFLGKLHDGRMFCRWL